MSQTGKDVLSYVWFCTMSELHTILHGDDAANRLKAADLLLKYYTAMGQSINLPYIPVERPEVDMDDLEEDDEDNDD